MPIVRAFKRGKETLELSVKGSSLVTDGVAEKLASSDAAIARFVELSRKRLEQGWEPTSPAKAATKLVAQLEDEGVRLGDAVMMLSDDEVDLVYADLMKRRPDDLSLGLLRRRPTRKAFAWMLGRYDEYYIPDWPKAVKFLAKTEPWITDELATKKKLSPKARAFADRWIKQLGKAAPAAPKKQAGTEDEAELLAAIAAAPDEDGPRAIYADWLLDRGDKMGEYIHGALAAAAKGESTSRSDDKKLTKDWAAQIRPFMRTWSFERGLISDVTTEGKLYVQAAHAIALRCPRGRIDLTGVRVTDIPLIAASPLGSFRTVMLDSQRLDDAQLAQIVSSPTFAGVEGLAIRYNRFGDAGVLAIANSPYAMSLRELWLDHSAPFAPATLAALLAKLGNLKVLAIPLTGLDDAFAGAGAKLTDLQLELPKAGSDEVKRLLKIKSLAGLERLDLGAQDRKTAIDVATQRSVVTAFPKLVSFGLASTELAPEILALLAKRA